MNISYMELMLVEQYSDLINDSTGDQTFNVKVGMENSQTWQSAGNVTFDDTVFSGSNGENLTLSGSSGITFTFAEDVNNALENTTGNEVTLIQDFAGTVNMDGVFYHTSLELQQGTFLLRGNDLVEGSNSNPTNRT